MITGTVVEGQSVGRITDMMMRSVSRSNYIHEFHAMLYCCDSGEEHTKERKLGYNPCSISYINGGSYIAVGGSNRKATLYTKVRLNPLREHAHGV